MVGYHGGASAAAAQLLSGQASLPSIPSLPGLGRHRRWQLDPASRRYRGCRGRRRGWRGDSAGGTAQANPDAGSAATGGGGGGVNAGAAAGAGRCGQRLRRVVLNAADANAGAAGTGGTYLGTGNVGAANAGTMNVSGASPGIFGAGGMGAMMMASAAMSSSNSSTTTSSPPIPPVQGGGGNRCACSAGSGGTATRGSHSGGRHTSRDDTGRGRAGRGDLGGQTPRPRKYGRHRKRGSASGWRWRHRSTKRGNRKPGPTDLRQGRAPAPAWPSGAAVAASNVDRDICAKERSDDRETVSPLRRGLYRVFAGGLLSAAASVLIALPLANAEPQCDQNVGQSIDSYLDRHPDVKAELQAKSQAEGAAATSSTTSIGIRTCGSI